MANVNPEELAQWVAKQTAYLDPPAGWQPDPSSSLTRLHARMKTDRPRAMRWRWMAWSAAAALVGLVILLLPAGRVVAQQLWQFLTVRQVAFIRVNPWPEGVPSPEVKLIRLPIPPIPARDVEEARGRVRYDPRMPRAWVLNGTPKLSTTFSLSAGTVVHVSEIGRAHV